MGLFHPVGIYVFLYWRQGSSEPISSACWDHSEEHPYAQANWPLPFKRVTQGKFTEIAHNRIIQVIMKMLSSTSCSTEPCGTSRSPVAGDQLYFRPLNLNLWAQKSSQFSTYLIVCLTKEYLSSLATKILWKAMSSLLTPGVLILLFIFLTCLMILSSFKSWLCSQGYHRPSHSSSGPLYSWVSDQADHLLWLMGPAFASGNILNTFRVLHCLCHTTWHFKEMLKGRSCLRETLFSGKLALVL